MTPRSLLLALVLTTGSALFAQSTLNCTASSPSPSAASPTGTAEAVGDYDLSCSGGAGQVVATMAVTLNTNFATTSVPILLVDNGDKGTFSGTFTAPNTVTFSNVAFTAPGASGFRVFRVTNVHADATQLGLSGTGTPNTIQESFSATSTTQVAVTSPTQVVAYILAPGTITCAASSPSPTSASPSGTAELAGDYQLSCMGGSGQVTTDVVATFNTNVATSAVPTLLIDSGTGGSFMGTFGPGATVVTFKNVTFQATGPGVRLIRITGVHVNAAQLGGGGTNQPTPITETVSTSNSIVSVSSATQVVANIAGVAPTLQSISPTSIVVGSPTTTLTVTGTNFDANTVVLLNGAPLVTTLISSTQLTAIVPVSLLTTAGTSTITVHNANGSSVVALTFSISNGQPGVISVSPATGAGVSQTFTFQFSHSAGYNNLSVVNALINSALDGRNACYIAYAVQSNTLYLVDDAGDSGPYASMPLNGTGSISNSQCLISGSGSSAVASGNSLTLTLNMSFYSLNFSGNKVVYAAARDTALNNTGWQTMAVFGVTPLALPFPSPVSMYPPSGSSSNALLTFSYQDDTAATNLQTVWALMNTALDGRGACYVAYYRPGNLLLLIPDNGDGTQAASMVLTGTNSVSNSQCTVSAAGSSVTLSGTLLTLTLNMTFNHSFAGPKAVWMAAATLSGKSGNWQALGEWMVP